MTCDDSQLALEKRRAGALAGDEAASLEAHLGGCAECRAYAAGMKRMEEMMSELYDETISRVDWDRIKAGFAAMRRREAIRFGRQVFLMIGMVLALWMTQGRQHTAGKAGVIFVVAAIVATRARTWRRQMAEAGKSEAATSAFYLRQLDRQIERQPGYILYSLAMAIFTVVVLWGHRDLTAAAFAVDFGVGLVGVGVGLQQLLVTLPRLRRERSQYR